MSGVGVRDCIPGPIGREARSLVGFAPEVIRWPSVDCPFESLDTGILLMLAGPGVLDPYPGQHGRIRLSSRRPSSAGDHIESFVAFVDMR